MFLDYDHGTKIKVFTLDQTTVTDGYLLCKCPVPIQVSLSMEVN